MEPGGPDEAQGADALLSLAALAEEADSPDTQSADEGELLLSMTPKLNACIGHGVTVCVNSTGASQGECPPVLAARCSWMTRYVPSAV